MYRLVVNGVAHTVNVPSGTPMLWVLRDILGLTGTKYGCGIEVCGACTVWVNGEPERSCDMEVGEAVGAQITTIEGLSRTASNPVQKAWIAHQVPQCGFCQSGVIMAAAGAMRAGVSGPAVAKEIGNVCVCETYQRMRDALNSI